MADNISKIYEKAKQKGVLAEGLTEEMFRQQTATEEGLKSFYDYATQNGMTFRAFDEFKNAFYKKPAEQPTTAADHPANSAEKQQQTQQPQQSSTQMQNPLTQEEAKDIAFKMQAGNLVNDVFNKTNQVIADTNQPNKPDITGGKSLETNIGKANENARANAEFSFRMNRTLNETEREAQELAKKASDELANMSFLERMAYQQSHDPGAELSKYDKMTPLQANSAAINSFIEDSRRLLKDVNSRNNFVGGVESAAENVETWDNGLTSLNKNDQLLKAVKKFEKGQELTEDESLLLDVAANYMALSAYYSDKLGRWYKMGNVSMQSVPFMLQFMATPIEGAGNSLTKALVKWGTKSFGRKVLAKAAQNILVNAPAMTALWGGRKIAAGTAERQIGAVLSEVDPNNGLIKFNGTIGGQSLGEAAYNSVVDTYVENLSEMFFEPFAGLGGKTASIIAKSSSPAIKAVSSAMSKIGGSRAAQVFNKCYNNPFVKTIRDRAHFSGYLGEVAEEEVGSLLRLALNTDVNNLKEAGLDWDSQIDTFLGLAPTSILFGGLGLAGAGIQASSRELNIAKYRNGILNAQNSDEAREEAKKVIKYTLSRKDISRDTKADILRSAYYAYQQKVADDIQHEQYEERAAKEQEQEEIKNNIREQAAEDGNIYPVTLDGDTETEYRIASGNFEIDENGKIVSDEPIVIKWQDEKGEWKRRQVTADELTISGEIVRAEDAVEGVSINAESEDILNEEEEEKAQTPTIADAYFEKDGEVTPATKVGDNYVLNGTEDELSLEDLEVMGFKPTTDVPELIELNKNKVVIQDANGTFIAERNADGTLTLLSDINGNAVEDNTPFAEETWIERGATITPYNEYQQAQQDGTPQNVQPSVGDGNAMVMQSESDAASEQPSYQTDENGEPVWSSMPDAETFANVAIQQAGGNVDIVRNFIVDVLAPQAEAAKKKAIADAKKKPTSTSLSQYTAEIKDKEDAVKAADEYVELINKVLYNLDNNGIVSAEETKTSAEETKTETEETKTTDVESKTESAETKTDDAVSETESKTGKVVSKTEGEKSKTNTANVTDSKTPVIETPFTETANTPTAETPIDETPAETPAGEIPATTEEQPATEENSAEEERGEDYEISQDEYLQSITNEKVKKIIEEYLNAVKNNNVDWNYFDYQIALLSREELEAFNYNANVKGDLSYLVRRVLNAASSRSFVDDVVWKKNEHLDENSKRVQGKIKKSWYDNLVPKKDEIRKTITGIYYDENQNMAVATNAFVIVSSKKLYNSELAGKIIAKDGTAIEGKFPNWYGLIQRWQNRIITKAEINVDLLIELINGVKQGKSKKELENTIIFLNCGDGKKYKLLLNTLYQALVNAKNLGHKEFTFTKYGAMSSNDDGYIVFAADYYDSVIEVGQNQTVYCIDLNTLGKDNTENANDGGKNISPAENQDSSEEKTPNVEGNKGNDTEKGDKGNSPKNGTAEDIASEIFGNDKDALKDLEDIKNIINKVNVKKEESGMQKSEKQDSSLSAEEMEKLQVLCIRVGNKLIEKDYVKFNDFFNVLVKLCGDNIRPYIKQTYGAIRTAADDELYNKMDGDDVVRPFDINKPINEENNEQENEDDTTDVSGGRLGNEVSDSTPNDSGAVGGVQEGQESVPETERGYIGDYGTTGEQPSDISGSDNEGEGRESERVSENGSGGNRGSQPSSENTSGRRGRGRTGRRGGTRGSNETGSSPENDRGNTPSEGETAAGLETPATEEEKYEKEGYDSESEKIKDINDLDELKKERSAINAEIQKKRSEEQDPNVINLDAVKKSLSTLRGKLRAVVEKLKAVFANTKREKTNISAEKVQYVAKSDPIGNRSVGSVVPSGVADDIASAFERLEKDEGKTIAEFVKDELGYESDEEMFCNYEENKDTGLSAEQVDGAGLAIHQLKKKSMFIIGDMTGVGKGRQAAAVIRWAKRKGKKVIYVTEKPDLFTDTYRDMKDIGSSELLPFIVHTDASANIVDREKFKETIDEEGNVVRKYDIVIRKWSKKNLDDYFKKETTELPTDKKGKKYDFVMTTYSQVSTGDGVVNTKKNPKLDWIREYAKDAIVILDESHNASGDSNQGRFFQKIVQDAEGVLFMSATFAKRPENMILYSLRSSMSNMNMTNSQLIDAVSEYGVPMQEIISSSLFRTGEMIRRERDFTDVKTTWVDPKELYSEKEYESARATSDKIMDIANKIIKFQQKYVDPIIQQHNQEHHERNQAVVKLGEGTTITYGYTEYKSQISNLMKLIMYDLKARKAAEMAIAQIKDGKKPVIAVDNTLGSYVDELDENVNSADFVQVLIRGLANSIKYRIVQQQYQGGKKVEENGRFVQNFDSLYNELDGVGKSEYASIKAAIEELDKDKEKDFMPLSPIDYIKELIEKAGYNCGEITGRKFELKHNEDGTYTKVDRNTNKQKEQMLFNGGTAEKPLPEKDRTSALILNTAGATGISLHASAKFGDQNQRSMIILQPAANASNVVQIMGRTDRTGQVHRSEYYYVISPIPSEQKQAMMLKKKLASLNANSVGSENVSFNRVDTDDMDNKYGDEIAEKYLKEHLWDVNIYLEGNGLKRNNKTGEWFGREGLLYDVLIGIQRLSCEDQENVLKEIQDMYKERVEFLIQNGTFDLSSSVMDLEAVEIDKGIFIKGKNNDSYSTFEHDTNIERVEVNVLKKPLLSPDIHKLMSKYGGINEDGSVNLSHYSSIYNEVVDYISYLISEREKSNQESEEKEKAKIRAKYPKQDNMSDEEYEKFIEDNDSYTARVSKNEDILNALQESTSKKKDKISYGITSLRQGKPYLIPLTDDISSNAPMSYSRFLGFSYGSSNPLLIKAVFAAKDSRSIVEVPLVSGYDTIRKIVSDTNYDDTYGIREIENADSYGSVNDNMEAYDTWWDKQIPKNTSKSIRYMVTNNIVQACGNLGRYNGTIVTYTKKDPDTGEITLERGMLLAEDFDPDSFIVRRKPTKEEIWDSSQIVIDNMNHISARRYGDYIQIKFDRRDKEPLSKHPIIKDTEFASMIVGDINKESSYIYAMVNEENLERAIDYLYKNLGFSREEMFVMPDSSERVDKIVPTGKHYNDVIQELGGKYGTYSAYSTQNEIKKAIKRYKLDINNESIKEKIKELVQLRQAYYRKNRSKQESSRLAWDAIIKQQDMAEIDDKDYRDAAYNEFQAIVEELEYRGIKGTMMHLEGGEFPMKKVEELFYKLNKDKDRADLFKRVFGLVNNLGFSASLSEHIDNRTAGQTIGMLLQYNWKYMNAGFITDQMKADTILHEIIHTISAYAFLCVENDNEHLLSQELIDTVGYANNIYREIKNDSSFKHMNEYDSYIDYGASGGVYEMIAEVGSNSIFIEDLKKCTLVVQNKFNYLSFLNKASNPNATGKEMSAYDAVMNLLNTFIDNFSADAFDKYFKGSKYGRPAYHQLESNKALIEDLNRLIEGISEQELKGSPIIEQIKQIEKENKWLEKDINEEKEMYVSNSELDELSEAEQLAADAVVQALNDSSIETTIVPEGDLSVELSHNTDDTEFLETPNGVIYGWAKDGKVYLTKNGINPDTPVHEYAHLWLKAVKGKNSELYENIASIFSRSNFASLYDELDTDPNYSSLSEEGKLSEVVSRFSGKRGAEMITQEADRIIGEHPTISNRAKVRMLIGRAKRWLAALWSWVGENLFGIKNFGSAEEVADRVMYDLLNNTSLETGERDTHFNKPTDENTDWQEELDLSTLSPLTIREKVLDSIVSAASKHNATAQTLSKAVDIVNSRIRAIRKAMSAQKMTDRDAIKKLTKMATIFLKNGWINANDRRALSTMIATIGRATEKSFEENARDLLTAVTSAHLNHVKSRFNDARKLKAKKLNISGVAEVDKVDIQTRYMFEAFNDGINLTEDEIDDRINETYDKMDDAIAKDDSVTEMEMRNKVNGYIAAQRYVQTVGELLAEGVELKDALADAKNKSYSGVAHPILAKREAVSLAKEAVIDNMLDLAYAYQEITNELRLEGMEGAERATEFRRKLKDNMDKIRHFANSDMEGIDAGEYSDKSIRKWLANSIFAAGGLFSPMQALNSILKGLARKAPNGEGYLYDHFVRGFDDASETEYQGTKALYGELDEKASDIMGKKMSWADMAEKLNKGKTLDLTVMDSKGNDKSVELTQGQLAYLYAVNKMSDGQMKLRAMGISSADMDAIEDILTSEVKEAVDWLQDEFLPRTRVKYNKVHVDMFGTPMARIENYFPLRINKSAIKEEVDLANDKDGIGNLPGTVTGAIKERRRNAKPLDIMNADAFTVAVEHVREMEHWAAFCQLNRDANILLSYQTFKNRLANMSTIYGAGKQLYTNIKDAFKVAIGTYQPKKTKASAFSVNIAKGVSASKVSFRLFTAIKQLLSRPAFYTETLEGNGTFLPYFIKATATPATTFKWAMKNLPLFEKRLDKRTAGDTRLLEDELDWKIWHSKMYEWCSKIGMSPNAFIDALTCAQGAYAIYKSRKGGYINRGMSEEEADKRALQDASIKFNETQQSSEGAFVSTMQIDKDLASVVASLFQNSTIAYLKRGTEHIAQLYNSLIGVGKEQQVEYLRKKYVRLGFNESDAIDYANTDYKKSIARNAFGIFVFGYFINAFWRLGGNMVYLLFGDDDDKKKDLITDSLTGGAFAGPLRGTIIGPGLEAALDGYGWSEVIGSDLPIESDIQKNEYLFNSEKYSEFSTNIINMLVAMGLGFNPETITNIGMSIIDACDGDLEYANDFMTLIFTIMSVPESQIKELYIDELGTSAEEIQRTLKRKQYKLDEVAKEYARRRKMKASPIIPMSKEEEKKQEKSARSQIKRGAKERIKTNEQ